MSIRFSKTNLTLLSTASALPGPPVSNVELLDCLRSHCGETVARRAKKYLQRLGIDSRHLSRDLDRPLAGTLPGRTAPELCRQALEDTKLASSMSFLIGHTATPHTLLPPNVSWVADALRFGGPYLELRQACTGFASSLTIAAAMIAENPSEVIAIVGSETGSPYFEFSESFADPEQLINCVQMGDGAGAAVFAADDGSGRHRVSDIYCGHIGIGMPPGISIEGGGSQSPVSKHGLPYFRHSASDVRSSGEQLLLTGIEAMEQRGFALDDFDWIIPHQVNGHIAELFAARFPNLRPRVFVVAHLLGNLGSAAIWIALDRLRRSGQLQAGQKVLVLGAEASKYLVGGFVYQH